MKENPAGKVEEIMKIVDNAGGKEWELEAETREKHCLLTHRLMLSYLTRECCYPQ